MPKTNFTFGFILGSNILDSFKYNIKIKTKISVYVIFLDFECYFQI